MELTTMLSDLRQARHSWEEADRNQWPSRDTAWKEYDNAAKALYREIDGLVSSGKVVRFRVRGRESAIGTVGMLVNVESMDYSPKTQDCRTFSGVRLSSIDEIAVENPICLLQLDLGRDQAITLHSALNLIKALSSNSFPSEARMQMLRAIAEDEKLDVILSRLQSLLDEEKARQEQAAGMGACYE